MEIQGPQNVLPLDEPLGEMNRMFVFAENLDFSRLDHLGRARKGQLLVSQFIRWILHYGVVRQAPATGPQAI